ncbi:MAG: hypothetical protein HY695_17575 [Deltaproteobacteria bacterium]|nr:hypothetical protein [Deltaproteobacteria bacterium]
MEKWFSLSPNRLVFDVASRLGSLEGYLYAEEKVEKSYLSGWLKNIDAEFKNVPSELRNDITEDYLAILGKVHALLAKLYGDQDAHTVEVSRMIADQDRGS